jgi:uncharacterized alpha-E superfamily protein
MLSRVANAIYWLSRYIERAENYGRYINVNNNLALDAPNLFDEQWKPILTATGDDEEFYQFHKVASREDVIDFMTFDKRNPNSIFSSISNARENARTIREVLPIELWEQLNKFYLELTRLSKVTNREIKDPIVFFDEIRKNCQLFWGMLDSAYTRNEGFHFACLGKFVERADKTSRFLDVKYFSTVPEAKKANSPQSLLIWSAVLKSASAFNMYRQQYRNLKPEHIVNFLIKDRRFPRSLYYSVHQAEQCLYEISGRRISDGFSNEAEKAIGILRNELDFTDISDIYPKGLHSFLDDFQSKNNELAQAIFSTYFDLKPIPEKIDYQRSTQQ